MLVRSIWSIVVMMMSISLSLSRPSFCRVSCRACCSSSPWSECSPRPGSLSPSSRSSWTQQMALIVPPGSESKRSPMPMCVDPDPHCNVLYDTKRNTEMGDLLTRHVSTVPKFRSKVKIVIYWPGCADRKGGWSVQLDLLVHVGVHGPGYFRYWVTLVAYTHTKSFHWNHLFFVCLFVPEGFNVSRNSGTTTWMVTHPSANCGQMAITGTGVSNLVEPKQLNSYFNKTMNVNTIYLCWDIMAVLRQLSCWSFYIL